MKKNINFNIAGYNVDIAFSVDDTPSELSFSKDGDHIVTYDIKDIKWPAAQLIYLDIIHRFKEYVTY